MLYCFISRRGQSGKNTSSTRTVRAIRLANEQFSGRAVRRASHDSINLGLRIGSFLGEQLSDNKRTHSYFLFPTPNSVSARCFGSEGDIVVAQRPHSLFCMIPLRHEAQGRQP
jgi:hypothetical protein